MTMSLTIMQEIIRGSAAYNLLHYGVRPRVSVWCIFICNLFNF